MDVLASIGKFILEHADLISLLMEAIKGGSDKDTIMKAIRASMIEVSDAVITAELGPRP